MKDIREIPILDGRRILVRIDTDVEVTAGRVKEDYRLKAALPTLRFLAQEGAILTLIGHLGRPKAKVDNALRLEPVARRLAALLVPGGHHRKMTIQTKVASPVWATRYHLAKNITLLENLRFDAGEESDEPEFVQMLAAEQDYFVNESFATVHRAAASIVGITKKLPSYAGLRLVDEMAYLSHLLHGADRPFSLIVGGAKVEEKLGLLDHLLPKVNAVLTGGLVANMFLKARGVDIKESHIEPALMAKAEDLSGNPKIHVPTDFVWGEGADAAKIFDLGRTAILVYEEILASSQTIFWAGSLGRAEVAQFATSTRTMANFLAKHKGVRIVAGGDTAAALQQFGLLSAMSFVSTGGGAALEYLAGKTLPGVEALR